MIEFQHGGCVIGAFLLFPPSPLTANSHPVAIVTTPGFVLWGTEAASALVRGALTVADSAAVLRGSFPGDGCNGLLACLRLFANSNVRRCRFVVIAGGRLFHALLWCVGHPPLQIMEAARRLVSSKLAATYVATLRAQH